MTDDASSLMLSKKTFEQFWKALVSRRKARKLNVDRDLAWQQLLHSGQRAVFLHADVAPEDAKRDKVREMKVGSLGKNASPNAPGAGAAPKHAAVASKTAAALAKKGRKTASRRPGTKRGAKKQSGAVAATTRRKRVAGRK